MLRSVSLPLEFYILATVLEKKSPLLSATEGRDQRQKTREMRGTQGTFRPKNMMVLFQGQSEKKTLQS